MNLLEDIEIEMGRETAEETENVFRGLGLPIPDDEEYLAHTRRTIPGKGPAKHSQFFVALNPYGIILRIQNRFHSVDHDGKPTTKYHPIDDPAVLQPIAVFKAGNADIEVLPGIPDSDQNREVEYLDELLWQRGVNFFDSGKDQLGRGPRDYVGNIGRLPYKADDFEYLPVVRDRNATDYCGRFQKNLGCRGQRIHFGDGSDDVHSHAQQVLFGPLKHAINEAWPDQAANPDPEKMRAFWRKCQDFTAVGDAMVPILESAWAKGYSLFAHYSQQYAKRLEGILDITPASTQIICYER